MGLKKWNFKEFDRVRAKELAEECDINSFLALLDLNRGITEAYEIDELFSDDIELEDPFSLADMDLASERILKAIDNFEKICVYGDYDCDGVTSTAIVFSYLKSVGADVIYYIPDRLKEGYGMNCAAIEKLKENVGIKSTIKDYDVDEKYFIDKLDEMVEQAFDDQCTGANPRYPLMSEIKQMYLNAYYGKDFDETISE